MTITSTAPTIDATGIHAPSYLDILEYFKAKFRAIYGDDVYLESDSQDGQMVAIFAAAVNDSNNAIITAYLSFSPATAQSGALSSNVKINGIARAVPSFSTVDVDIVGQAGTTITNGVVQDEQLQTSWSLPASVNIPPSGAITVTVTCQSAGAVAALPGTITKIATPTRGWQTVNNPAAATPGAPVEQDGPLRQRQAVSVAIPSLTVLEGIVGAVASLPGVSRLVAYENDTSVTDSNGIPSHSISLVVDGGDAVSIAQAIAAKKTPGAGTFGTTTEVVIDIYGIPHPINFFRPTDVAITGTVALKALTGFTTATGEDIQQAVSDYINAVAIGGAPSGTVEWDSAVAEAKGVPGKATFKISALTLSRASGSGTPDVPLAFNEAATCAPASIVLTVT